MAKYYFYTTSGRQGPVGSLVIKDMAARGGITETTTIEDSETGRRSKAGQISGLTFNQPAEGAKYYYTRDKAEIGPYTFTELKEMNCDLILTDDELVCKWNALKGEMEYNDVKSWISKNDVDDEPFQWSKPPELSEEEKKKANTCLFTGCLTITLIILVISIFSYYLKK